MQDLVFMEAPLSTPANERDRPVARVPLRRVARLFRPYRWSLAFVLLLVAASSLVSLVNPFLIREIIDVALPQGRTGLLTVLAIGMIVVSIANSSFSVSQTYMSTRVGQRVMHDLRTAVYSHLQRMSLAFFTRTRTGEVQSRIANDIGGMQATVTTTATTLVSSLTTVVATVIAMAALDWRLTIVSLIMMPVFVWVSRRVGSERRRITGQRQRQLAALSSIVQESLSVSGILLGHTMGRSRALTDSFATESDRLSDLEVRSSMAGRWRQSTIQIVMSSMPAVIYWATGLTGRGGHMLISIGTLVAFTTLQQNLFRPTVQLLGVGVDMQSSLELFSRIFEYLDLPVDIAEPERPAQAGQIRGDVRLHDVGFRYPGAERDDAARHRHRRSGRPAPGDRGRDRLGQDDPQLPDPAPVRRDLRQRDHRRHRRTRPVLRRPRPRGRRRLPGDLPLPRLRRRKPAVRQAGRDRRRTRRGGQGRADPRAHRRAARRLRHPGGGAGLPLLRRRETAPRDRPGHPA